MAFQHHIFVCTNERTPDDPKGSCMQKGAAALHQHMKERCHALGMKGAVRVNKAGCLDCCSQGPAVVVYGAKNPADGVWYTLRTKEEVDRVIEGHLQKGEVQADLVMPRR